MKKIVIGSRESVLAVAQTQLVMDAIKRNAPQCEVEMLTMKTTGDIILDRSLDKIGGKGLFVKELDRALLEKRSDLSVHSLKDLPAEISKDLPILAYTRREDPRDVFVYPDGQQKMDIQKPVGCSSKRRMFQLQVLYPNVEFKSIRGNVLTRLQKLDRGEYGALILAAAGLKRLGLSHRISRYFEPDEMVPAAGQGILAVQGRAEEEYAYLKGIEDTNARFEAICERAFIKRLNGGCSVPVGAYAQVTGDKILLRGYFYNEENQKVFRENQTGAVEEAEAVGISLADKFKVYENKK